MPGRLNVSDAFVTVKPLLNLLAMEPVYLTLLLRDNFSDLFHGHEMPNVSESLLSQCILEPFQGGFISITNLDMMPATPEDIVSMMKKRREKRGKPRGDDEWIQFTQRGGAVWEKQCSFDWSRFYRQMVEECGDGFRIEVTSVSETGLCRFLAGVDFVNSGAKVLSVTPFAGSWEPIYWKTLESGWKIVLELTDLTASPVVLPLTDPSPATFQLCPGGGWIDNDTPAEHASAERCAAHRPSLGRAFSSAE